MGYNKKQHLEDNIRAIELAFELEKGNIRATEEQRDILRRYSGFGGLKCILKPCGEPQDKDGWLSSEKELFDITSELYGTIKKYSYTDEEYKSYVSSLKESVLSAFYTPNTVIGAIRESFSKHTIHFKHILDPSAGTGAFVDVFKDTGNHLVCFEKDLITAKILGLLHPQVEVNPFGFETIEKYNDNYFDLVTSNIPFGNYKVYDPAFSQSKDEAKRRSCNKIHNYFFIKAIDVTRDGGIIAFITSPGVMDTPDNRFVREKLMNTCNLISVVRMPNNLFTDIANTEAGSDLIILQKNTSKEKLSLIEEAFIETRRLPNECSINNYFMDFSRVIHTKVEVATNQYGNPAINFYYEKPENELSVELLRMLSEDFEKGLNADLYLNHQSDDTEENETYTEKPNDAEVPSDTTISLYDLFGISEEERTQINKKQKTKLANTDNEHPDISISTLDDPFNMLRTSKKPCLYKGEFEAYYSEGTIVSFKGQMGFLSIKKERKKDQVIEQHMFNPIDITFSQSSRLKSYMQLRDAYYSLFNFEYTYQKESFSLRSGLNLQYQEFVAKHGNLNNKENYKLIISDKHGVEILTLEHFENGQKQLADIFREPVSFSVNKSISGLNADEALVSALNLYGYPHFAHMVSVSNKTTQELEEELKGIIYYNPLLGRYEISTHLVSGDVVTKAEEIEAYIDDNPDAQNIEKSKVSLKVLKDARPEPILFADLDFNFGERWIPEKYYNDYISGLFATSVQINYFKDLDDFSIVADNKSTIEITEKYAIKPIDSNKLDGLALLSYALLNTQPKITKGTGRYNANNKEIRVADTEAIQQANIKIDEIRSGFADFLGELPMEIKNELADLYNRKFNSRVIPKYDGMFQTFPDLQLAPLNIPRLYDSQYNTVWMLKSNMGGVVDHEVGSGKTLTICTSAHEMKRLKMIDKPLILGKKGNIFEIASTYAKAYPNDKILYPTEKDFEPKNRKQLFNRIKNNNWDVIIMTHDQFFKIPQSLEMQFKILQIELDSVEENLRVAEKLSGQKASNSMLKGLEIRQKNLKAALQELYDKMQKRRDDVVDFKTMGIDHIFLDESHVFKNLMFNTRYRNVAGLGNPIGSQRALNLLYAIRTMQDKFDRDLCATFLSGTTISNSLVELYLIFKYLRPRALEEQGIRTFDAWAAVYTKKSSDFEFTVTNEIKSKERFRYFKNVPELANFYNEITDYKRAEDVNIVRPKNNIILYPVQQTPEQIEFQKGLIEFARTGEGKYIGRPGVDYKEARSGRMLVVTDLARKAAIDLRLIDAGRYHDHPDNKISQAAKKIMELYYKYDKYKATQFVFSDIGTYNPDKWNVYSELKRKLVEEYHLPADEIRFIQEASNMKQRKEMIDAFKVGRIRVLIGHTESLGTGVDAPQKCIAIHNISMPWTPKDLDQRGGRGARKGNEVAALYGDNKVDNYMYAAEGSLDTYMFNLLQNKQTFITQLKTNSLGTRIIDEGAIDAEGNMNYSEFVAILSGNTDLLDKAKLEKKIYALESEFKSYNRQLHNTEYTLHYKERELDKDSRMLKGIKSDWVIINEKLPANAQGIRPNPIKLNNFSNNNDLQAIGEKLIEMDKYMNTNGKYEPIGKLLDFTILIHTGKTMDGDTYNMFFVEGTCKYSFNNGYLAKTPELAASNFIRSFNKIPDLIAKYEKDNLELESDIKKLQEILRIPWKKESELKTMKTELDRLERKIKRDLEDQEKMHIEYTNIDAEVEELEENLVAV